MGGGGAGHRHGGGERAQRENEHTFSNSFTAFPSEAYLFEKINKRLYQDNMKQKTYWKEKKKDFSGKKKIGPNTTYETKQGLSNKKTRQLCFGERQREEGGGVGGVGGRGGAQSLGVKLDASPRSHNLGGGREEIGE